LRVNPLAQRLPGPGHCIGHDDIVHNLATVERRLRRRNTDRAYPGVAVGGSNVASRNKARADRATNTADRPANECALAICVGSSPRDD
jgi:hypothetical protein